MPITNRTTGEVIADGEWEYRDPRHPDNSKTHLSVQVQGTRFDASNIGMWTDKDGTESEQDAIKQIDKLTHPQFGEYQLLNGKRKYSKVYQLSKPTFSKPSFRQYWFEITYALEMNTGIIRHRAKNGTVHRIELLLDWQDLLDCSEPTVRAFVNECTRKGYVAKFLWKEYTWYIVNPQYCWNGHVIPKSIWGLFNPENDE